jgi:hypothetical protein
LPNLRVIAFEHVDRRVRAQTARERPEVAAAVDLDQEAANETAAVDRNVGQEIGDQRLQRHNAKAVEHNVAAQNRGEHQEQHGVELPKGEHQRRCDEPAMRRKSTVREWI